MLASCHLIEIDGRPALLGFWEAPQSGCEVEVHPPRGGRSEWLWEPRERVQRQKKMRLGEVLGRLPEEWHQWAVDLSNEAFSVALAGSRERLAMVEDSSSPGLGGAFRSLEAAESLARQLHEARVSWAVTPSP